MLDKPQKICYNKENETKEVNTMKYRQYIEEKVCGRRNWTIRVYDNTATLYGFSQHARECGEYTPISEFYQHNMSITHFTLKKDALDALEILKARGYKIIC
jgi:hypothetical protein